MTWKYEQSDIPDSSIEQASTLQGMLISLAQNGGIDNATYSIIRENFMGNSSTHGLLPDYIRTCRDDMQLWHYLKTIASDGGSWEKRRNHIYKTFRPLLDYLEERNVAPADASISKTLSSFDPEGVHRAWEKALDRRHQDPEGAITSARTLLEAVCKRILDEADEQYTETNDLPALYSQTSALLKLAPSQHTEKVFKSILGGCHTIVQNLGTLRNKIGDAHAQGKNAVKPSARHAALAVNLAGTMATFLIETWKDLHKYK